MLIFGSAGFILSFTAHIIIWRVVRPLNQVIWIFSIFILLPVLTYVFIGSPVFTILWHIALSAAYIMSYPAIQAECPTLKIVLAVSRAMPKGLAAEDINSIFTENKLLSDRFDDLIKDKFIFFRDNKWVLSPKGRFLVNFFSAYRRTLNLPLGEG